MESLITTVEQATSNWLSKTLNNAGVLPVGEVSFVEMQKNSAFNSSVAHLSLSYSLDAPANAPQKLLLKLNQMHWGESEVKFYKLAGSLPMLVTCYSAAYDAASGNSYLLLQDVSQTHVPPITRKQAVNGLGVPTENQLEQIVAAIAGFHAFFWQHSQLGQPSDLLTVRWYQDKGHYEQHVLRRHHNFEQFKQSVGKQVPQAWLELYSSVLSKLPQLWERYFEPRVTTFKNITLTNGDCYFTQFLCSRLPTGQAYLVDFQEASANFGAFDLVFLFATFWTPAQRHAQQREEKLLRNYLSQLQTKGVVGYDWEDLMTDYRLMLTLLIFFPVWDQTNGSDKSYWWPKMECLLANFQDLDCISLFQN